MSNPFEPYAALYGPEAHPVYPWWRHRHVGTTSRGQHRCWVRSDGRETKHVTTPREWFGSPEELKAAIDAALAVPELLAEIERIDAEHPLPAPPAVPTQVWRWRDRDVPKTLWREVQHIEGATRAVVGLEPKRGVYFGSGSFDGGWDPRGGQGSDPGPMLAKEWPPAGAVLVWGPFAPWAPPGWKP